MAQLQVETLRQHRFNLSSSIFRKTVFKLARRPAWHETVANPRRLSRDRGGGVAASWHRVDAVAAAWSRRRHLHECALSDAPRRPRRGLMATSHDDGVRTPRRGPRGGSFVIFTLTCITATGKWGLGFDVSQSRNDSFI